MSTSTRKVDLKTSEVPVEKQMLEHFFSPKSVAVIGASREKGKVGYDILKNILDAGFEGDVYPVNPKADEIAGLRCYPNVKDIPGEIDLAVYVLPAKLISGIVDDCAEKGIDSLVVISAGFKESGPEGARLEHALLEQTRGYGMRVIGPNCLGIISTSAKINATFAALTPAKGNIAFFSQSGALCTSILDWAAGQQIGFSKFVSLGNKMDVDEVDMLRALSEDDQTEVMLGYIEGVKDGAEFIRSAREATALKPVIVSKSGGTAAGARAASSHTGTLAGSETAFNAAFTQSGILRAKSMQELFDLALVFSYQGRISGSNVAVVTNAGGPGIIASDAIERSNLKMASFTRETIDKLRSGLPPTANVYNPVDVIGDAKADRYQLAMEEALGDPKVDAVLCILTPQAMTETDATAQAVAAAAAKYGKMVVTSFIGGPGVESGIELLAQASVPNFAFPERAIDALNGAYRYRQWVTKEHSQSKNLDVDREKVQSIFDEAKKIRRHELGETEAREVVTAYGFTVPRAILARTANEAADAAEDIGFPVVMKIASPDILHKSDIGGVRVNIGDRDEVIKVFHDITDRAENLMPDAEIQGISVQQMVKGGKEVILGCSRDPQFGPLIMFGLGGIYVEVLKDVSFRIAPLTVSDAETMVREIRSYPLLSGVRGEKPVDFHSITDSLLRLSQLVTDFPDILELDVNPLSVFPDNGGAIAIDARLRIEGD